MVAATSNYIVNSGFSDLMLVLCIEPVQRINHFNRNAFEFPSVIVLCKATNLRALWTIVGLLTNKRNKIGKCVMAVYTVCIFCLNMALMVRGSLMAGRRMC